MFAGLILFTVLGSALIVKTLQVLIGVLINSVTFFLLALRWLAGVLSLDYSALTKLFERADGGESATV